MIEVFTSMDQSYYEKYGKRMIISFLTNWKNTKLIVYWEGIDFPKYDPTLIKFIDLETETELLDFKNRHRDKPNQDNKLELKHGAIRFAPKAFSIIHRLDTSNNPYDIWLDADSIVHSPIDISLIKKIVNEGITYLGRSSYPESGYICFKNRHQCKTTNDFYKLYKEMYCDDQLFKLDEWHDAYVFGKCIERIKYVNKHEFFDLTPEGKGYDHVFINSVLGNYIDHMKGPRKDIGHSKIEDFYINPHMNSYWNAL